MNGSFARGENGEAILTWTCLCCGWHIEMEMPGYPGTGYEHTIDGEGPNTMCPGPIIAMRK